MSVINQMLKDLEKRQQPTEQDTGEQMIAPKLDYQKPSKGQSSRIWLWCSLSLLLGGCLTFSFIYWQKWLPEAAAVQADITEVNSAETTLNKAASATVDLESVDFASSGGTSTELTKAISAEKSTVELDAGDKAPASSTELINEQRAMPELVKDPAEPALIEKQPIVSANAQSSKMISRPVLTSTPDSVDKISSFPEQDNELESEVLPVESTISAVTTPVAVSSLVQKSKPINSQATMKITPVVLSTAQLVEKEMQKAEVLESKGMLEQAIVTYKGVLKLDGSQHLARKKLAALLYGQSRLAQASKVLTQGQALYPEHQQYLLLLARVQLAANADEQAIATLSKMNDSGPEAKQKWLQLSALAQKLKDFPRSENAFRQLARIEPNEGRWWMWLAYALDSQQAYSDAFTAYQHAAESQNLSTQSRQFVENRIKVLGDYR